VQHHSLNLAIVVLGMSSCAMAQADPQPKCLLSCFKRNECTVLRASDTIVLRSTSYANQPACNQLTVGSDGVLVRYRHKGAWFSPATLPAVGSPLSQVFAQHKPDACSVPDFSCTQTRMQSKVAAVAGHGIDSQQSLPAGTGEPCSLGLPCGTVLLPQGAWQFRLEQPLHGQWELRLLRGEAAAGDTGRWTFPVQAGVVQASAEPLSAGRVYAYTLVDRSGTAVASGEFETVGARRQERLAKTVQLRVQEGSSEQTAWVDTLVGAEMDWSAIQRMTKE
jgi:hypothetical protein